jgi:hypothetical protein
MVFDTEMLMLDVNQVAEPVHAVGYGVHADGSGTRTLHRPAPT